MGQEAGKALTIISDVSVQIQQQGWYFNEEIEFPLNPSAVDGTIVLPANCLSVKKSTRQLPKEVRAPSDRNRFFTMRGWNNPNVGGSGQGFYLYDLANQTYYWTTTNSLGNTTNQPLFTNTIYVEMILAYPFEDIPQAIRWYIMAKAGNLWGVGRVPDQQTYRFTQAVVDEAESEARKFDEEARDAEPEENPHFMLMRRR